MTKIQDLKIKIFADGADLESINKLNSLNYVKGFTTNPTLMRKSGINDYAKFAKDVLKIVKNKPISFEVFSDDLKEMEKQAMEIVSWGTNANVKIPISNSKGESSVDLIGRLSKQGVLCNVTAIFTIDQSINELERAYDDAKYGRISKHPFIQFSFPSMFNPDFAPNGKHVLSATIQYMPYHLSKD